MKPAYAFSLLLSLVALSSASAAWQKLPNVEKRHVETGVSSIKGAKLVSSNGIGQADSLMSDDPIAASTLPAGTSEAVINLGKQRVVSYASFVNDSIEGKVTISGSTDMKSWNALAQQVFTPADRQASMDFAGFQGKYIKIQFELSKGGVIRHFQLIGADTDKDFKVQQTGGPTKLNLANGIGGSRVIYVHPSPNKRGDAERAQNKFDFPESDEKYRTIIYDLGTTRTISEFGSVHSPRPVRFEVFTFDQLPEKEDWRGRLSFDPQAFEATQPVAQAEDPRGVGYIKVKTQKPVKARYVALRWEPDFNPPAFTVGGTNITGSGFEEVEDTNNEQGTGGQNDGTGQDTPVTEDGSEKDNGNMGGGGPLTGYGTSGYAGGGGSLPSGGTTNTGGSTGSSNNGGGGGGGGSTVVIQQAANQPASPIQ